MNTAPRKAGTTADIGRATTRLEQEAVSMRLLSEVLHGARLSVWAAEGAESDYALRLWNRGAERIYGYSPSEALGRNYIDLFVSPKDRKVAIDTHRQTVEEGREFGWNFVADDLAKDGTAIAILGNSFRVWDDQTSQYLYAEVGIDITNFEQISQQLDRARQLAWIHDAPRKDMGLIRGLEVLNAAIASLSQPDELGLERVIGAIREGVREMLLRDLLCRVWMFESAGTPILAEGSDPIPQLPRIAETELVKRAAKSTSVEVLVDDASIEFNGEPHSLVGAPLHVGTELRGVVLLYLRGTTPLSESDQALLRPFGSYAAVAAVVGSLAREQQLRRYRDTERIRQAIIESVLHTVGNEAGLAKLAADSLSQELSRNDNLSIRARRELDQIQSSADRLGQVMGEIIRLNVNVGATTQLRVVEAVRIVTRTVERDHYDKITVSHDIDPDLWVEASEYLLREAVNNLVRNAVQAMIDADGGGELLLSADMIERDWNGVRRCIVRLDIEDSGPGVPPELHERVWESGFTTRGEDHGHGLFHTRGLAQMLGGAATLMKTPSRLGGAHFRLFLIAAESRSKHQR